MLFLSYLHCCGELIIEMKRNLFEMLLRLTELYICHVCLVCLGRPYLFRYGLGLLMMNEYYFNNSTIFYFFQRMMINFRTVIIVIRTLKDFTISNCTWRNPGLAMRPWSRSTWRRDQNSEPKSVIHAIRYSNDPKTGYPKTGNIRSSEYQGKIAHMIERWLRIRLTRVRIQTITLSCCSVPWPIMNRGRIGL